MRDDQTVYVNMANDIAEKIYLPRWQAAATIAAALQRAIQDQKEINWKLEQENQRLRDKLDNHEHDIPRSGDDNELDEPTGC